MAETKTIMMHIRDQSAAGSTRRPSTSTTGEPDMHRPSSGRWDTSAYRYLVNTVNTSDLQAHGGTREP